MRLKHNIKPVYNSESEILILGSFPSVVSRDKSFFYAHKQNKMWKVLSKVFNETEPVSIEDKKKFLLRNKIAMWDMVSECDIVSSKDNSIKNVIPNEIDKLVSNSSVKKIFSAGRTSYTLYNKYMKDKVKLEAVLLPSTSPANASYTVEKLVEIYKVILEK